MIKILEKISQKLNALTAKVFKKETYPYPPLSRRERRKFERDNIKAEKNIALCRRCMKNAPSWWCPGERCYFFPYRRHVLFGDKKKQLMEKKVLTLTVSKEWFDMIVSGEKNEEYRVIKDFWMSRLLLIKDEEFKDFDKYDKLHIGKTFEMLIDINTIKEKLNNGTMKFVPFTHVLFKNGYYDDSPKVEKEIESIAIGKPKKGLCPDKWLDKDFFVIKFKQRMKQKKVELCVPGSLIWSQIDDYLDTDLIGGGKRVRHSGRAIREILESGMII